MKIDKEKIKEENRQREEYIRGIFDNFLIDAKDTFNNFDLSNMDKNSKKIKFDVETEIYYPASYLGSYNVVVFGRNLDDKYTEEEKKHAIYHELVHMSTTKNAKAFNAKTGFSLIAGPGIIKRIAITEGMTDYMTERITGKELDLSYVFEKRCAKALCDIFGDEILQDFLNADENMLYKRTEEYGISKKEMKQLFNSLDKGIAWRNDCVCDIEDGKKIKKKNKYISDIEEKLVNMAARVSLEKGKSKEEIVDMITQIQNGFIPTDLKFNIDDKVEENFLSEYSEDLDKPNIYAEKLKNEIMMEKITSSSQLVTQNKSIKEKMFDFFKGKNDKKNVALPSSGVTQQNIDTNTNKESFISELENLKNSPDVIEEVKPEEKEVPVKDEKTI